MIIKQRDVFVGPVGAEGGIITHFANAVAQHLPEGATPLRFAISRSDLHGFQCEVATIEGDQSRAPRLPQSIFQLNHRGYENCGAFSTVLVVPTGIGATIGGHAGDAGPIATLLASVSDRLITHPNVVNASDINELPLNGLYVEGSVLTRLLMGTVGLRTVRANRVLVVLDAHEDESFVNAAINSVSAARATYGLNCPRVVIVDPPIRLTAGYTEAGIATGSVEGLDRLCRVLDAYRGDYDAVAISSVIEVPKGFHRDYFQSNGAMVNPWGGVEAILTHAVSSLYDVPSAHSPMLESQDVADEDPGVVDPRMAAEAVSVAFLQCILKGLQRSPRIVTNLNGTDRDGVISARDISCLVIPDGALGLPTLAALEQGIPVIAVKENQNVSRNELTNLPWPTGKFFLVNNYWEAAGLIAALKAGIAPDSTRRPLAGTTISRAVMREGAAIEMSSN